MNPAKYSFSWALGVVHKLNEKYPRASEDMKQLLGITDRNLAAFLATGDPIFPDIRNMIHWLDNAGRPMSTLYTTEQVISQLRKYWRCKSSERIFKRIDGIVDKLDLKRAGFKGGRGEERSDDPRLPLTTSIDSGNYLGGYYGT